MNCSLGASTRSLRALFAAAALASPLAITSTASADHQRGYREPASVGSFRIDGKLYYVSDDRSVASQIASAFSRAGYYATVDYETVIVRFGYGCRPRFQWSGYNYRLSQSWRSDSLVLKVSNLRRQDHRSTWRDPIRSQYDTGTITPSTFRIGRSTSHGGEQTGGVFISTGGRTSVVTIVGEHRDDPDWGRRDTIRPDQYDRGYGRSWNQSCDSGFDVRYNWKSRRR